MKWLLSVVACVVFTGSPAHAQNLHCVCPYYKLGPKGGSTCGAGGTAPCFEYLAYRHTGSVCAIKSNVRYITEDGAINACIPPKDCSRCDQLGEVVVPDVGAGGGDCCGGATDFDNRQVSVEDAPSDTAGELQPVSLHSNSKPFTQVSVPVEHTFEFDPATDGVTRDGTTKLVGAPFYLKICKDERRGESPKYLKVFMFTYTLQYNGLSEPTTTLLALGFECKEPPADAEVHRVLAGAAPSMVHRKSREPAADPEAIDVTFGLLQFTARVANADDWLQE